MSDSGTNPSSDTEKTETTNKKQKTLMIELTQEEYNMLTEVKEANGFTWKGMLIHAKRCLDREGL